MRACVREAAGSSDRSSRSATRSRWVRSACCMGWCFIVWEVAKHRRPPTLRPGHRPPTQHAAALLWRGRLRRHARGRVTLATAVQLPPGTVADRRPSVVRHDSSSSSSSSSHSPGYRHRCVKLRSERRNWTELARFCGDIIACWIPDWPLQD